MKKHLVFLGALAIASGAWAGQKPPKSPPPAEPETPAACDVCSHDVVIKGPQLQVTSLTNTAAMATAGKNSYANNNVSSNTSGVLLNHESVQITAMANSGLLASADNGSYANNNLASNIGSVAVDNKQLQAVVTSGAFIAAKANHGGKAVQNFSSNNGCTTCW